METALGKARTASTMKIEELLGSNWLLKLPLPPLPPPSPIEVLARDSAPYQQVIKHFDADTRKKISGVRKSNVSTQHKCFENFGSSKKTRPESLEPLFHGTPEVWRSTAIATNGFDLRIRLVGRALGDGVYASRNPNVALGYCGQHGSVLVMCGWKTDDLITRDEIHVFPDPKALDVRFIVDFGAVDANHTNQDRDGKLRQSQLEHREILAQAAREQDEFKKQAFALFRKCSDYFAKRVESLLQDLSKVSGAQGQQTIAADISSRFGRENSRYEARLPIYASKATVVDTLRKNAVTIVLAETGSGKSTQLPQYLLDEVLPKDEHRSIAVLQPKRVNATELYRRVATEWGDEKIASFRLGHGDNNVTPDSRIEFLTHGLFVQLAGDPVKFLKRYCCVVLDEAHERSVEIDLSFALLRRAVFVGNSGLTQGAPSFRAIVASASVAQKQAETYRKFLCPPNLPSEVISIPGRTFPIQVQYRPLDLDLAETGFAGAAKALTSHAVQMTLDLVTSTERGNVLVFLPGSTQIRHAMKVSRQMLSQDNLEEEGSFKCTIQANSKRYSLAVCQFFGGMNNAERDFVLQNSAERVIIFSTDLAETGLTLPDIRYVIDTGLERHMDWDEKIQAPCMVTAPATQSAMQQRTGRAGRTASGLCIRLFSEETSRELREDVPEILGGDITKVALRILAFQEDHETRGEGVPDLKLLDDIPPARKAAAHRELESMKAIQRQQGRDLLTPIGRHLLRLGMDLPLGLFLIACVNFGCVGDGIDLCSLLLCNAPEKLLPRKQDSACAQLFRSCSDASGDHWTLLKMFSAFLAEPTGSSVRWCQAHKVDLDVLQAASQRREFLMQTMLDVAGTISNDDAKNASHGGAKIALLRAILSAYPGNLATFLRPGDCAQAFVRVKANEIDALETKEEDEPIFAGSSPKINLAQNSWLWHCDVTGSPLVVFTSIMGTDQGGKVESASMQVASLVTKEDVLAASPEWCQKVKFDRLLEDSIRVPIHRDLKPEEKRSLLQDKGRKLAELRRIGNTFIDTSNGRDTLVVCVPRASVPLVQLKLGHLLGGDQKYDLSVPQGWNKMKFTRSIKELTADLNSFAERSGADKKSVQLEPLDQKVTLTLHPTAVSLLSILAGRVQSAMFDAVEAQGGVRIPNKAPRVTPQPGNAPQLGDASTKDNPRLQQLCTNQPPSLSKSPDRDEIIFTFVYELLWRLSGPEVLIYGGFVRDWVINGQSANDIDVLVDDAHHLHGVRTFLLQVATKHKVKVKSERTKGAATSIEFQLNALDPFEVDLVNRQTVPFQPPGVDCDAGNMALRREGTKVSLQLKVAQTHVLNQSMPPLTQCIQHARAHIYEMFYDPDSDVGKQRRTKYDKKKWRQLPPSRSWWQL